MPFQHYLLSQHPSLPSNPLIFFSSSIFWYIRYAGTHPIHPIIPRYFRPPTSDLRPLYPVKFTLVTAKRISLECPLTSGLCFFYSSIISYSSIPAFQHFSHLLIISSSHLLSDWPLISDLRTPDFRSPSSVFRRLTSDLRPLTSDLRPLSFPHLCGCVFNIILSGSNPLSAAAIISHVYRNLKCLPSTNKPILFINQTK